MANSTDRPRRRTLWISVGVTVLAVGAALFMIGLFRRTVTLPPPGPVYQPETVSGQSAPEPEPQDPEYPTDRLFIAPDRAAYQSGELRLRVPRLDLDCQVLDGTDEEVLDQGVGLYEYATLPSRGNPNTSIAGHRDLAGAEFYFLDTLGAGDCIYLTWNGCLYTYEYLDTVVVENNDWSVVFCTDQPIVTLTTCTPLGTTDYRMIVTARLVDVRELDGDAENGTNRQPEE